MDNLRVEVVFIYCPIFIGNHHLYFSLSYDLSNTADYKQIHSKNMSVRNNIKTIRKYT